MHSDIEVQLTKTWRWQVAMISGKEFCELYSSEKPSFANLKSVKRLLHLRQTLDLESMRGPVETTVRAVYAA